MRNVIVTGGTRGLGLGIVHKLIGDGYHVVAIARRMNDEFASVQECAERSHPGSLCFVPFDLAETQDIPDLVKKLHADSGPIYGLINNAGLGFDGVLATMQNSTIE